MEKNVDEKEMKKEEDEQRNLNDKGDKSSISFMDYRYV